MKKYFVLIGCLLYIYSVHSQGTWRTVDSLYRARAYADAYTLTRQCYEQSLQALAAPAAAHSPAMQGVHAYNLFRSAVSLVKVSAKLPNPVDAESLMRRTLPKLDAYPEGALFHTWHTFMPKSSSVATTALEAKKSHALTTLPTPSIPTGPRRGWRTAFVPTPVPPLPTA